VYVDSYKTFFRREEIKVEKIRLTKLDNLALFYLVIGTEVFQLYSLLLQCFGHLCFCRSYEKQIKRLWRGRKVLTSSGAILDTFV